MKIDVEKLKVRAKSLITQFDKDAVIFLLLIVVVLFFGFSKFIAPKFSEIVRNSRNFSEKKQSAQSMQKKMDFNRRIQQNKVVSEAKPPVKIYKIPYMGDDLESSAVGFINQVISVLKQSGANKILSINFEKEELKDQSGIVSTKQAVLSMKIELESSYEIIQNMLNEIYLMEYLIDIDTVSLSTLEKYNHKRVQAYMVLDLYLDISS